MQVRTRRMPFSTGSVLTEALFSSSIGMSNEDAITDMLGDMQLQ
jgi:hypothetical protein